MERKLIEKFETKYDDITDEDTATAEKIVQNKYW